LADEHAVGLGGAAELVGAEGAFEFVHGILYRAVEQGWTFVADGPRDPDRPDERAAGADRSYFQQLAVVEDWGALDRRLRGPAGQVLFRTYRDRTKTRSPPRPSGRIAPSPGVAEPSRRPPRRRRVPRWRERSACGSGGNA
jgi:hypothetical protein